MITTQSLLQGYKIDSKVTRVTERGELLTYFLSMMNPLRVKSGYKGWNIKQIGYFLSVFGTGDLYVLKRKCMESKNYGACFNSYVFGSKKK